MKKNFVIDPNRRMPFSSAVKVGEFIFCSGHAAIRDEHDNELTTIEEQTKQVINNIKKTLTLADATLEDVVKVTIFLKDRADFSKMNEVYKEFFDENLPARSTCITNLVNPSMLLEVECIAYKSI